MHPLSPPTPASTDPSPWQMLAEGIIPASAILISTLIAIGLAVLERRAANRDRTQQRADRLLEEIIELLAFFVSVNPRAEDMKDRLRALRARVVILQTLPGRYATVGTWLAAEARKGLMAMEADMMNMQTGALTPEEFLTAMRGTHQWAHGCVMLLAAWLRGEVKTAALAARAKQLQRDYPEPSF